MNKKLFLLPGDNRITTSLPQSVNTKREEEIWYIYPLVAPLLAREYESSSPDSFGPPLTPLTSSFGGVFLLRHKGKPICFIKLVLPINVFDPEICGSKIIWGVVTRTEGRWDCLYYFCVIFEPKIKPPRPSRIFST